MPNHVENVIYLEGPEEQIQVLLEKVKYDEYGVGSLDFRKVIPMPDSLNIESGSRTTRGLEAYEDFWKVYTMAGTVERDPMNVPKEKEKAFLRTRTDIRRDTPRFENRGFLLCGCNTLLRHIDIHRYSAAVDISFISV